MDEQNPNLSFNHNITKIDEKAKESEDKRNFSMYIQFWIGQVFSLMGSAIVSFIIIWQLSEMEPGNNTLISVAFFVSFFPQIVISPLAGVIADKMNKKIIIIISDFAQATLTLILIILFALGVVEIWHILLLIFFRGICQAFQAPISIAIIPLMVPKDKMTRVNGLNYLLSSLINMISPIVGAWLLIVLSPSQALWIDIFTFFIAFFTIIRIRIPKSKTETTNFDEIQEKQKKISFFSEIKAGLDVIHDIKGLGSVIIMAIFLNFIFMPVDALMINFIKINHGGTKVELGYFMAALQLGMLLGALLTILVKKWRNWFAWIILGLVSEALAYLALGLIPEGFFILLYIDAVMMLIMNPIVNSLFLTGIQNIIPKDKIGRISSIIMMLSNIASPIGLLLSGIIADAIGSIPIIYICCGILTLIVLGITVSGKGFRQLTKEGERITNQ
ncbi:MAG: MFS transporter [Candidatus Lokiarchaeota archaeon]|nr:MFS transporter [Candidatus Harpocratesius repetitus]